MSRFTTTQEFFRHQDLFVQYVIEKVNPARTECGLDTVSEGAARQLFHALEQGNYLRPKPESAEGSS